MWSLIPWKKTSGNRGSLSTLEPIERDFQRLRSEFDSLLARMWGGFPAFGDDFFTSRFGWDIDLDETNSHYVVRIPAPGFEVEDFDVQVSGNQLVVKAERKESHEDGNGGSGYRFGRLQRMITLPDGVEADKIEANYHSGVLEVKVAKGKESQVKRIEVKAG
jgi:HSP20 family protein